MTDSAQTEKEALKRKNSLEKAAVGIVDQTLNIAANRLRDEHSKVGLSVSLMLLLLALMLSLMLL